MVKGEDIDFSIPEQLNIGSYFLDINLERGRSDRIAIYYENETYTFKDLWALTNKVGNVLRELGVEPENRVLLILQDSPEWVASWLATMKIGGVGTHAYTYLKSSDYEYLMDLVRPKVVIADQTTLDRVRRGSKNSRFPKAILVAGETPEKLGEGEFNFYKMVESVREHLEVEPTHRDDIAFWNFTGGTTGKPRGLPHMHRDWVVAYEACQAVLHYTEEDLVLRVPKLFFHYARDLGMLFPLRAGAGVVLFPDKTTAKLIFDLVKRYKPSVLLNVPTMMRAMLQTPERERTDLSCLRLCMSSGELLSANLYEEWVKTFGGEVVNRFGSAESCMGYLCNRPGAMVPGSSGTVAPMAEVKLVDNEGCEVPVGEPGVLMARCDAASLYYVRDHEKSKATFLGDDWINTGDMFRQDERDYFWYLGRSDEMVKVSGVWVSPLEIERSLQTHSDVKECVVFGLEDRDGLIMIKASVVLNQVTKRSEKMADELKKFCKKNLASYKYPRVVEFLNELPKTGQGKIDKRQLRERGL